MTSPALLSLREAWRARWDDALSAWSRFTRLSEPRWCLDAKDEAREGLEGSFAMIRLGDRAVVVSLAQVERLGLEAFAREILAHEVGHHVLVPADLRDAARLLARIRRGLPTREAFAPLVANLWGDLLINDRLQRSVGLDMAAVYRRLKPREAGEVDGLYLRTYEVLWGLPPGDLGGRTGDAALDLDASLGARLVRAYAKSWLGGGARFALLLLPYLLRIEPAPLRIRLAPWLDADRAGATDSIPGGLATLEDDELEDVRHPAEEELDPEGDAAKDPGETAPTAGGVAVRGGTKSRYREPQAYTELLKSAGVTLPEEDLVAAYYKERALEHAIRFPTLEVKTSVDPQPEGLDPWEAGSPISSIDWLGTLTRSPRVIPGLTTVERAYGETEGSSPTTRPPDLYLGIDCSGSMTNPKFALSYPVLAGVIVALAALRAGAHVMATLSGEPGQWTSTGDFGRDERRILRVLTGYLGTGYAFGIARLEETFLGGRPPKRPTHVLVVSDSDMFQMAKSTPSGWDVLARTPIAAGGGATMVLDRVGPQWDGQVAMLVERGWAVQPVSGPEDLVAFGKAFGKAVYERPRRRAWVPS